MAPFKKRFGNEKNVTIACSGTGAVNSARKTENVLNDAVPANTFLFICGFAGGLSPESKPGDVIIAEQVTSADWTLPLLPDSVLSAKSGNISLQGSSICRGKLLSVDSVLSTPGEKKIAFGTNGALAVDMETAAAASAAEKRNIRWLSVRAITDGADDHMPFDFNKMAGQDGQIKRSKIVFAAITYPWKIPALIRLGKRSSKAAHNLTIVLEMLIRKLQE